MRKQPLVLYPFVLGFLHTLAFVVPYSLLAVAFSWSGFAKASFDRWGFLHDNLSKITGLGPGLAVLIVVAVVAVVLTAAIRAPYFYAIIGQGYPIAPRRWTEILNLSLFYALSYAISLSPLFFSAESFAGQALTWVVLLVLLAFVFADYIIVFEGRNPLSAIRRSWQIFTRGWAITLALFIVQVLLFDLINLLYSRYYAGTNSIFFLLPLSQLLLEAVLTLIFDAMLIFLYSYLRRS